MVLSNCLKSIREDILKEDNEIGEEMFSLVAFIFITSVAAVQPELKRNWVWETKPTIELCPDSKMSIEQAFEAIKYWTEQDVHVPIQRVRKVDYCDPAKLNVIQVHDHIDFDRERFHAMTKVKWYYYGTQNSNTIYYIDRVRIQIPNDTLWNSPIVLHEFGHSMGLGHSDHPVMKTTH